MLHRIRNLLVPQGKFRIAPLSRGIPRCEIRALEDADIGACEHIYRLNEPAHFPDGYFPRFSAWLRQRHALILVVKSDGEVRGLGGISAQKQTDIHFAALSFGMVHPSHHRLGYGSALLLARLSLLQPEHLNLVMLSTVRGSETFYRRFGFSHVHSVQTSNGSHEDHYVARVSENDRKRCVASLRGAHVSPALLNMPIPGFAALAAGLPGTASP